MEGISKSVIYKDFLQSVVLYQRQTGGALELRFYKSNIVFTFRLECNERFGSGGGAVCVLCGGTGVVNRAWRLSHEIGQRHVEDRWATERVSCAG